LFPIQNDKGIFYPPQTKCKKTQTEKRKKKEKTEKRKGKRKKPQNYETVCQRRFPNTKKTSFNQNHTANAFSKHKKSLL